MVLMISLLKLPHVALMMMFPLKLHHESDDGPADAVLLACLCGHCYYILNVDTFFTPHFIDTFCTNCRFAKKV